MANTKTDLLPFTNDFIFSMVMQNPEICKGLLDRILPDEDFSEVKLDTNNQIHTLGDLLSVETQRSLKFDIDSHGIRFDAYAKAESAWAEIEMQTYTREDIGKRSRYYHANMDMDLLDAGKPYQKLKKTYVIFICTFDHLKKGEPIYHYQNYDIVTDTYLGDDAHTIILNTSCPLEKVPDRLKPLYAYINNSEIKEDSFIEELDSQVRKYNSPEWRKQQMTLEHIIEREREIATDRVNRLAQLLIAAGRTEDFIKSTSDSDFQKKLFEEFDL